MIDIYAVNIKYKFEKHLFDHLTSYLTDDMQERIKKFHRLEDAQRTLIADILLRIVICSNLGIKNKDIVFYKNEYGKPFLKYDHNLYFNISHSGEWVVCVTHSLPVGVDIEYIQPIDFDIAKRFFSKVEYNDLMNIDNSQRLSYFYVLWTLKESFIKAVGKGLSIPLDSFSFKVSNKKDIMFKSNHWDSSYFFKQYDIDRNYKLAVCGSINELSDRVKIKEISEVCTEACRLEEI